MTMIHATTTDTEEVVTVQALPALGFADDGWDYMGTLDRNGWGALGTWGVDGWDLGCWPYVIISAWSGKTDDGSTVYGVGSYCEGDTSAEYFRTRDGFFDAISRHAFTYWRLGQADGPDNLPEKFDDLHIDYRRPCAL